MASPLLAASSARPLDPHKQAKYTLHLSDALTQQSAGTHSFTSVKFNHKPSQSDSSRKTTISKAKQDQYNLSISDSDDGETPSRYTYSGQRRNPKRSYVLVFDQNKQSCTLEPLSSSYTFNLQSTPWEKSASKLSQQYSQLSVQTSTADTQDDAELEDDYEGASGSDPDDNNPFDFRHFVKGGREGGRSPFPEASAVSAANTPQLSAGRPTAAKSQQSRTSALKKAPVRSAAAAKRKSPPPSKAAPAKPTPTVRLDRRASTRPTDPPLKKNAKATSLAKSSAIKSDYYVHSSDDEDDDKPTTTAPAPKTSHSSDEDAEGEEDDEMETGGLEIDFGGSTPPRLKNQRLALPVSPQGGHGPISLRSAASSPHSRITTPAHASRSKPSQSTDDVIEFGDDDAEGEEDDEFDDVDMLGDGDIEPISLGSPAHEQRNAPVGDSMEIDEDDDELEAELMRELSEADGHGVEEDESDVSEEE